MRLARQSCSTKLSSVRGPVLLAGLLAVVGISLAPGDVHAQDDTLPPQIVHEPCEFYQKGKPFQILARFFDDSPIFDPKVVYRKQDGTWRNAPFTKLPGTEDFAANIPKRELRGPLEYFIEAFDENGNGPARYGTPEAPLRLTPSENAPECTQVPDLSETTIADPTKLTTVPGITSGEVPPAKTGCEADDPPAYCSPALWTVVGILVVGGATVGVLFGTGTIGGGGGGPGIPDLVTLDVASPNPTLNALRFR